LQQLAHLSYHTSSEDPHFEVCFLSYELPGRMHREVPTAQTRR
jgi:hypothetical protein